MLLGDLDLSGVDEGGEVAQRGGRDVGQHQGRVVAGAVAQNALKWENNIKVHILLKERLRETSTVAR